MDAVAQEFAATGAVRFFGVLVDALDRLENAVAGLPSESAGVRLQANERLREMLEPNGCVGAIPRCHG